MVPSVEKLNKLTTQELREMKSAYESDRHERKELIDFIFGEHPIKYLFF